MHFKLEFFSLLLLLCGEVHESKFKYLCIYFEGCLQGLSFIHASEISFHGNLKSSNCVVDSRFVLKLTDFGLHGLRDIVNKSDLMDYDFCKELFKYFFKVC